VVCWIIESASALLDRRHELRREGPRRLRGLVQCLDGAPYNAVIWSGRARRARGTRFDRHRIIENSTCTMYATYPHANGGPKERVARCLASYFTRGGTRRWRSQTQQLGLEAFFSRGRSNGNGNEVLTCKLVWPGGWSAYPPRRLRARQSKPRRLWDQLWGEKVITDCGHDTSNRSK